MGALAAFQPVLDGSRVSGCVIREGAGDGFAGTWHAYGLRSPLPEGVRLSPMTVREADAHPDLVQCGAAPWLTSAFAAVGLFNRHKENDGGGAMD